MDGFIRSGRGGCSNFGSIGFPKCFVVVLPIISLPYFPELLLTSSLDARVGRLQRQMAAASAMQGIGRGTNKGNRTVGPKTKTECMTEVDGHDKDTLGVGRTAALIEPSGTSADSKSKCLSMSGVSKTHTDEGAGKKISAPVASISSSSIDPSWRCVIRATLF